MSTTTIPSYDLARGDRLSIPFKTLLLEPVESSDGTYNSTEPHRHNYHEIFYFVRGGGWHDIDFRSFPIKDHSIHFVSPGQVHQIRRSPDSYGHIILFSTEFYALDPHSYDLVFELPFINHSSPNQILHPSEEDARSLLEIIGMIHAEFNADRPHKEGMLRSYLNILMLRARRIYDASVQATPEGGSAHELVNKLRGLIEKNYTTIHAPGEYAEMLCVSQNHLNSTVRKMLGRTIGDLVHDRIILEAQRLLFNTELTVKEIAFQLNYDDPSYFTRFFRKHAGVSPQEFRESARKKHQ